MRTLNKMIITSFLPSFVISILFFIFLIELVDLFSNIWRYLNNGAGVLDILKVAWLYIPKSIIFSTSPALLFSVAYTMGNYYANNELIAIFGSGISLLKFTFPLIFAGLLFSFGSYLFSENYVIESYKAKNNLSNILLGYTPSYSNTNITVISGDNQVIYHADYYNDNALSLSGLIIILRDSNGQFTQRIDAEWAEFKDNLWEMKNVRLFLMDSEGSGTREEFYPEYTNIDISETPGTFKRLVRDVNELNRTEAKEWILSLRKAGLPMYRDALVDYYERFSFSLTPMIIIFISSSLGGRFKKNVLLMSLLSSLSVSVLYYVLKMILILLAKQGYLQPISGAWGSLAVFTISGIILYKKART